MNNNNKHTLVPKLRFPEFQNDQWRTEKLASLGETINGLNGKSAEDFGKGKPFVTYKQVFDSSKVDLTKCGLVEIKVNENQNTIQKGDILFTTSSETPNEVGFASVLLTEPDEPTYLNSFCFSFRPFSLERLKPEFSQFLFHSPTYRKSIGILAQGITRFNISKSAFLNIKVPLPSKPAEQQKIASCLSSLDEVITGEQQKLELLKQHKKGLLQNLFPQSRLNRDSSDSYDEHDSKNQGNQENHKNQGSDNVPKLRFKEFENSGEWEVKKVGDILVESKIPLKINDLEKRITVRLNLKGVEKREYRGTESENATYFFERKKGQFIYGKQNLHKGAFGIIPEELDGYASSQDLPAFDFKNGFFPKFFLHYLSQETVYPELEKIATGTGSKRIHPKEFYNVSIPVPSLPEQQKIAACLSSLDDLITAQTQKIEQLQRHKKGLLQGLFPFVSVSDTDTDTDTVETGHALSLPTHNPIHKPTHNPTPKPNPHHG